MNMNASTLSFMDCSIFRPIHRHITICYLNMEDVDHLFRNCFNASLDHFLTWKNPKTRMEMVDLMPLFDEVENGQLGDDVFMLDTELMGGRHYNYMMVVFALSSSHLKQYGTVVSVIARSLSVEVPVRIVPTDCFSKGKSAMNDSQRNEVFRCLNLENQQNIVFPQVSYMGSFCFDMFYGKGAVDYLIMTTGINTFILDGDTLITISQDDVLRFIDWRSGDIISVIDFYDTTKIERSQVYSYPALSLDNQEAMLYVTMATPGTVYRVDLITHQVIHRFQPNNFFYKAIATEDHILLDTAQENLMYDEESDIILTPAYLSGISAFKKSTGECVALLNGTSSVPCIWKGSGEMIQNISDMGTPLLNEGKLIGITSNSMIRVCDVANPGVFDDYHPGTSYYYYPNYVSAGKKYVAYKHSTKNLITVRDSETKKVVYKITSLPRSFYPETTLIKNEYLFVKSPYEIRVFNLVLKTEITRIMDMCETTDPVCCIQ
eukprot:TRINITY_DN1196_c2_g2_i3.p1 TRINITY_DN1196_c2_g2~~TRINITY_DN1196_c2_g2_i3.p1  ORF type:complete len:490 (+),score=81.06 TRINITY_DN1196_c2_g2_i3:141-1610(+)